MSESNSDDQEIRLIQAARKQAGGVEIGTPIHRFDDTADAELNRGDTPAAHPSADQIVSPTRRLRDYQLFEKLGEGGMGAVYRAIHGPLQKTVAVKILSLGNLASEAHVTRFQREMRALGRLEHPNIVTALDAGNVDGMHYLAMQYVKGWDLQRLGEWLHNGHQQLAICDACEMIRQAADGLQHAHRHGLIHRDIKPSNLMLSYDGQVKILDLGLALVLDECTDYALTGTGHTMGTLDFMAPEQAVSSHEVDIRADIYSLGATLYHLVCGRPPLAELRQIRGFAERTEALKNHVPRPPSELRSEAGPDLDSLLGRMLQKDAADRFATPAEAVAALQPFCVGADLPAIAQRLVSASGQELSLQVPSTLPSDPGQDVTRLVERTPPAAQKSLGLTRRRLLIAGSLVVATVIGALLMRPLLFPAASPDQISIRVGHYRQRSGENAVDYFGTLGHDSFAAQYGDLVKVVVELDQPAYCYLFACNPAAAPENQVQPCIPQEGASPQQLRSLDYPGELYFRLNDGVGQQAFFVVVSTTPLPPLREWLAANDFEWDVSPQTGVWEFDGSQVRQLFKDRGQEVAVTANAFQHLARQIMQSREGISVRAIAFPVLPDGSDHSNQ